MKTSSYWLLKTEPATYSFTQLLRDKKTNWNGVRNFQARNFLREIAVGDIAVIYHSGDDKAAVGTARITRSAYADPDPKKNGDWVQIDLEPLEKFKRPVLLAEIKKSAELKDILLIRQSRLSVMPITETQYKALCKASAS